MRLVILGAGESGSGAALLAKQKGIDVFVSDAGIIADKYKHLLITHHIPFEEAGHTIKTIKSADEVIKSPGIPKEAAIITELNHLSIIDEIEFAARYAQGMIIAITGSNGKSTTVSLVYHLLKSAGCNVALAGNIGYSFAKCITEKSYDYYVLELSAAQLEGIRKFKPAIACLLNITPDHLDRYYSIATYAKAKLNILRNMTHSDHFIYNQTDNIISQWLDEQMVMPNLYPIAMPPIDAIFSSNGGYNFNLNNHSFSIRHDLMPLPGIHNQYNATVAITAAVLAGVSPKIITTALPKFHGLPHRLEWCGAPQGINCYNDSKATNVASAAVALNSFIQPIIWIIGGQDKGNDYSMLLPIAKQQVKAMICLGKDNSAIIKAFYHLGIPIQESDNMDAAITIALSVALPGEVILLSPASASFDLFKNFEDRGNQFRTKITSLI